MDNIITENNQHKQQPTRTPRDDIDGDKVSGNTAISSTNTDSRHESTYNEVKLDNDVSCIHKY